MLARLRNAGTRSVPYACATGDNAFIVLSNRGAVVKAFQKGQNGVQLRIKALNVRFHGPKAVCALLAVYNNLLTPANVSVIANLLFGQLEKL
ncbi:hypothetical protein M514_06350 [Trichuris suis]|uniref:Uncharacterized protein n=1 Tax=Trichuris suis TaxID=68888 RepID=A0A085NPT7_9BILA|nr:hypothetical protein M514_06350 [Trichuris suis]